MAYSLSRFEQEVSITFNAGEDVADLYTADPVWIRKLDKLALQNPEQFRIKNEYCHEGKPIAKRYEFPKRFVSIRSKDVKKELTEEQRVELSNRMKEQRKINSESKTKEAEPENSL